MTTAVRERQLAEAESIEAIFAEDYSALGSWLEDGVSQVAFTVVLDPTLAVRFWLPEDYPEGACLRAEAVWTGAGDMRGLRASLVAYLESLPLGDEMAYDVVTWCQERLAAGLEEDPAAAPTTAPSPSCQEPPPHDNGRADAADVAVALGPCGRLSLAEYFRAEALGEGACGSVMMVYDNDGRQWAGKQFETAEDGAVDTTTLREIGLLRALRAAGSLHPNVVALADMASINGELCMIMASYKCSLRDGLLGGALAATKGSQVRVAGGLLKAVAFLHACKTFHRDIKPGNIMLTDELDSILIDFSLGKLDLGSAKDEEDRAPRTARERRRQARGKKVDAKADQLRHSQGVGTPLYMAPEVCDSDDYQGPPADMWSLGLVLLEVFDADFCVKFASCEKEKAAHSLVAETVGRLGTKPIPSMLRSLLEVDPSVRVSAQRALEQLGAALPQGLPGDAGDVAPVQLSSASASSVCKANGQVISEAVSSEISQWATFFRCSGRVRRYAEAYARLSARARETPLHATILAARLHEHDREAAPCYDLEELAEWVYEEEVEDDNLLDKLQDLGEYIEAEQTILRELDYHLY